MEEGMKRIQLPASRDDLAGLMAGEKVYLCGPCYTMRDAGHERALAHLRETGQLPFGLEGQCLFYAGPTPALDERPFGAIGPTTASRMDFATPEMLRAGITCMIGKGKRSEAVRDAIVETGSAYFVAVGGVAALLAEKVVSEELIAWEDLGTEALRRVELEDFPVYVEIDAQGRDLYRSLEE